MKSIFAKVLLIVASAAAILAASVYAAVIFSPKIAFYFSVSTALSDFLSRDELSPIADSIKHTSLELDSSVREYESEKTTSLCGKIYSTGRGAFVSGLKYDDGLTKVSGNLYFDADYMYFDSEDTIGGAYGLVSGTSAVTFENSVFADSDSKYALGESEREKITKYLSKYDDGTLGKMPKETKKILTKYSTKAYMLACEHGDFSDENTDARHITLMLDKDALINICDELYASLVTDKDFRELFVKYADIFDVSSDPMTVYRGFIESFGDLTERLKSPDYDLSYVIKISMPRFSARLQSISVTSSENGEQREIFTLYAGAGGLKRGEKISLIVGNNTLVYEIKEDTSEKFELEIYRDYKNSATGYEYSKTLLAVKVDRTSDELEVLLNNKCTVLCGSLKNSLMSTEILIDGITRINSYTKEEYKFDTAKISIVLKKLDFVFLSGEKLSKNEIKPLSDLKESDIKLGYVE